MLLLWVLFVKTASLQAHQRLNQVLLPVACRDSSRLRRALRCSPPRHTVMGSMVEGGHEGPLFPPPMLRRLRAHSSQDLPRGDSSLSESAAPGLWALSAGPPAPRLSSGAPSRSSQGGWGGLTAMPASPGRPAHQRRSGETVVSTWVNDSSITYELVNVDGMNSW